ncbi:MAG TPA: ABC transporter permease, partial [Chryseolinea sp.]|nr:ABC transporter permease [Chryseolinea sp.]
MKRSGSNEKDQRRKLPPRIPLRLFRWYCRPDLVSNIEGDLVEEYNTCLTARGARYANWRFTVDVALLCRPGIIKSYRRKPTVNSAPMYKSYLKIAWRNLLKNRGFSAINVGGLAIGMAVAILIGLWVYDEISFNTYYKKYERLARVYRTGTLNGETLATTYLPIALGEELQGKYGSDFKHVAMVWPAGDHIIASEKDQWSLLGEFMQPQGMAMFTLNMLEGTHASLDDPHSIVLSKSAATTLFGSESALGKLIKIDNTMDAKVTGVYEDIPRNAHFSDVQFFAPWDLLVSGNPWIKSQGFGNNFLDIYVELIDGINIQDASGRIKDAVLNNIQADKEYVAVNPQLFLHPMKKWHLWANFHNGVNTGLIEMLWLFGVIGIFVLVLACINFMNLSTARAEKRAKEIGIRKAIGSVRSQLIAQFYCESFVVAIAAFFLSLIAVTVALPWLNDLSYKQIEMPWNNPYFWASCAAFIFITGILSGSYPAIFLSAFNATKALKGALRPGRYASLPRKVLVIAQFSVSIVLIVGTVVVYKQLMFAKDRPVGYERKGLVNVLMNSKDFQGKYDVLRNELKNTGVITEMALSSSPPTEIWNTNGGFDWDGKDPGFIAEFATFTVTPTYGSTVGWQFIDGRDFTMDLASDSAAFVINEAAAKVIGY